MLICLVGAKGSPGTTTAALALAMTWPQPVLLVEGDPAGGDLRAGYLASGDGGRNITELAARARHGLSAADIAHQCIPLEHDETTRLILAGPPTPFAGASLDALWTPLLHALPQFGVRDPIWVRRADVLVDCGTPDHPHMPWGLVEAADLVVVVLRATARSVAAASPRMRRLGAILARMDPAPDHTGLLIGAGDYTAAEVGAAGLPVAAVLAYDPDAAAVLSDGVRAPRSFHRSQYMRSARAAAAQLHTRVARATHGAPEPTEASAPPIPHLEEEKTDEHVVDHFVRSFDPIDASGPQPAHPAVGLGRGPAAALRSGGAAHR